jgi:tRNA-Thr(GGU) m(6)t(6)A37 methyltransferase TsaA
MSFPTVNQAKFVDVMNEFEKREGEVSIDPDPAGMPSDGHVIYIGRVTSPWKTRSECPKNLRQARERGEQGILTIAEPFRAGLKGLKSGTRIIVLSWFDRARRDLIVQHPRHADAPTGTFALRSPVRPNPVGLHVVAITGIDHGRGIIGIDAIDLLDGTPVIDIKPYYPSIDAFPEKDTASQEKA